MYNCYMTNIQVLAKLHIAIYIYTFTYSGSREHMLSAGMWCSVKKPLMSDCLRPIMQELESLATEDISHLCPVL